MNRILKQFRTLIPIAAIALVTAFAIPVHASQQTFDLIYAGINGSAATASGTITFDPSVVNADNGLVTADVTGFSITVTGASSGNGTFGLADYDDVFIDQSGPLDFTTQLVGQSNLDDFNFLTNSVGAAAGAPAGSDPETIQTDNRTEDILTLTSFLPAVTAAPEPSPMVAFAIGALGIGGLIVVRRKSTAATQASSGR
jgi:hypothetical protein